MKHSMKINKCCLCLKINREKKNKGFIKMGFLPSGFPMGRAGLWRLQERALTWIKLSSREWVSKGFVLRLYLGSSFQGLCFSSLVFMLLK